jgi:hypothetical protein
MKALAKGVFVLVFLGLVVFGAKAGIDCLSGQDEARRQMLRSTDP